VQDHSKTNNGRVHFICGCWVPWFSSNSYAAEISFAIGMPMAKAAKNFMAKLPARPALLCRSGYAKVQQAGQWQKAYLSPFGR